MKTPNKLDFNLTFPSSVRAVGLVTGKMGLMEAARPSLECSGPGITQKASDLGSQSRIPSSYDMHCFPPATLLEEKQGRWCRILAGPGPFSRMCRDQIMQAVVHGSEGISASVTCCLRSGHEPAMEVHTVIPALGRLRQEDP